MNTNEINDFYIYLQSQQSARHFLQTCYKKLPQVDAEAKSYENCTTFMYYLEHGRKFYETGKQVDIVMQPMLFFYGMVHLVKACLLTKRPNYPESTTILAHGASTRKRKKKNYTFLTDEVKIQHQGLFPYFSEHLFSTKRIPFQKLNMEELLGLIPELHILFQMQHKKKLESIGKLGDTMLAFPTSILDQYHLTKKAFISRIQPYLPQIQHTNQLQDSIVIELEQPVFHASGPLFIHQNETLYFPSSRDNFWPISEVMVHYLLLYNLSMLSRYEAEWWGDLLVTKSEIDYPFILRFLQITEAKIPFLLGTELYKMV